MTDYITGETLYLVRKSLSTGKVRKFQVTYLCPLGAEASLVLYSDQKPGAARNTTLYKDADEADAVVAGASGLN